MADIRDNATIKTDIETAKKITRKDIYEVLQNSVGKTIEDKTPDVETFVDSLSDEIKNKVGLNGKTAKESILTDLSSYPI